MAEPSDHNSPNSDPLHELQKQYQDSLVEKFDTLTNLIKEAQTKKDDPSLEALRNFVHKIAGSSGTYGYTEASVLCKDMQNQIDEQRGKLKDGGLDETWLTNLTSFLDAFKKAFEKQNPEPPATQKNSEPPQAPTEEKKADKIEPSNQSSCSSTPPEDLLKQYQDSLVEKFDTLTNLIKEAQTKKNDPSLEALRNFVHKIAGSSGMYGYTDASGLCKDMQNQIDEQRGKLKDGGLDDTWLTNLTSFLDAFKKAFEKQNPEPPAAQKNSETPQAPTEEKKADKIEPSDQSSCSSNPPEDLLKQYQDSLVEKFDTLTNLIKEAQTKKNDPSLEALRNFVHKIAGSSGMYGYTEASVLCKDMQNQIDEQRGKLKDGGLDDTWLTNLTSFLDAFKKAFEKQNPEPPAAQKNSETPQAPPEEKKNTNEQQNLLDEYKSLVPEKIQKLTELIQAFQQNPSEQNLDTLRFFVHKIAGSSGMYGYSETSKLCKHMQQELDAQKEKIKSNTADKEWIQSLSSFIENFKKSFEQQDKASSTAIGAPDEQVELAKIFLCDDTPDYLNILIELGKKRGLQIEGESDFNKAKERLSDPNFKPDILLVDVMWDGHENGGQELINAFNSSRENRAGTVLGAISATDSIEEKLKIQEHNIDLFFAKTINSRYMIEELEKLSLSLLSKKSRVLLLDDDIDFCKSFEALFDPNQIELHSIQDPSELQKELDELSPEILIIDIHLAKHDGLQILQVVKADYRYRDIAILVISADENLDNVKKAVGFQAQGFLTKPIDPKQTQEKLYDLAKRQRFLFHQDSKDPTTGFYRKRAIIDWFSLKTLESNQISIAFIDIHQDSKDEGKTSIPQQVGELLSSFFSKGETIGLWSENEILIIFNETQPTQARYLLSRFFDSVKTSPIFLEEANAQVSLSAYILAFPGDGRSLPAIWFSKEKLVSDKNDSLAAWEVITTTKTSSSDLTTAHRILLIDDDDDLLALLSYSYLMRGIEAVQMKEGKAALDWIQENLLSNPPSLIVLDLNLPDESGIVILQKIKSIIGEKIPVIILTERSKERDVLEGLRYGADAYITKPFDFSLFMERTQRYLQ